MKKKRHEKIMELIRQYPINTQEELMLRLREAGFEVTQATISRDIKELRLVKILSSDGNYRYAPSQTNSQESTEKFYALFVDSVVSVGSAQNIVCVKCLTGMANAVCAAMDTLVWGDIVGTLSGDDTIFILMKTEDSARRLADKFEQMIR